VSGYDELFRDAYALLHGGRGEEADAPARYAGEGIEDYLARTRVSALAATRKLLLAADVPDVIAEAHRLLLRLVDNAIWADEALAEQVRAYQCGHFHESVAHSDRLQTLVVESERLDRELIGTLRNLAPGLRAELGIRLPDEPA
jgi:hypothetical protein